MIEIEKYAQAAASTARTPPNSPARRAALEMENAARVEAEQFVKGLGAERDRAFGCLTRDGWEYIPDSIGGPCWKPPVNKAAADLRAVKAELAAKDAEIAALTARLSEIEAQEPVAISKAGNLFWAGNPQDWRGVDCSLFTHPAPAQAVPDGCGACGDACAKRGSCRLEDESPEAAQ